MRILHFADVHLDRPFVGLPRLAADRRRHDLYEAFRRCLAAAQGQSVDLVTIGGDLWEEEHVLPDTRNSVAHDLETLGTPVLLLCGNHDPLVPGGGHATTSWPNNVTVVDRKELKPHAFGDTTIWAVSWGSQTDPTERLIETANLPSDGATHVLLVHGTARGAAIDLEGAYFPFDPEAVTGAGFALALAGHVHLAGRFGPVVYPGSPEPLGWGEQGRHCVALIDTGPAMSVELIDINERRYTSLEVDCAGCRSSAELESRVERALEGRFDDPHRVFLRVHLVGEIDPDCVVDEGRLAAANVHRFAGMLVKDETEPLLDLESRAQRKGLDGLFVRRLRALIDAASTERERRVAEFALRAGIRALEGKKDVLRVD